MVVDGLYYGSPCPCCHGLRNEAADTFIHVSTDVIENALRNIYAKKISPGKELDPGLFRETLALFNEATVTGVSEQGYAISHSDHFIKELKTNNEVFAAFRTHTFQRLLADQMVSKDGGLKSFSEWKKGTEGIVSHFNERWLRTEYDTAVIRAHQAADWRQFEAEKDVLPNLTWLPTTSLDPDKVHRRFWEARLTLPIDDPFWERHRPGDRWNCKCSLEATDEDSGTYSEELDNTPTAQPGLKNNPGKDKELFSDDHPYFPDNCGVCPLNVEKKRFIIENRKKDCYNCQYAARLVESGKDTGFKVQKEYKNGGRLLVHKDSDFDKPDYKAIYTMCNQFAKMGKTARITPRVHVKSPDYERIYGALKGTKHYGKCPDFSVDGTFYEFEGFTKPWKKEKVGRMLSHGMVQSPNIVIENNKGCSERYIRKAIIARRNVGSPIREVWIYEKGKARLFFKDGKFY